MNKFEQLIEYVINDDADKARELFHDIVVEKSREIYESMMDEDSFGGDSSDDLIDDVECDEEGINMEDEESDAEFDDEAEEEGEEFTHDLEDDHDESDDEDSDDFGGEEGDIEDRVDDLEDKLDELMAEFEDLLGSGEGDEDFGVDGGDELAVDDTEEFDDFDDGEEEFSDEEEFDMMEAVSLSAAPKPKTSEESFVNKKSINDNNSGQAGMASHPVKIDSKETTRSAPKAGELIGKVQNTIGGDKKLSPATKPHLGQASGVNTKTPFPKG